MENPKNKPLRNQTAIVTGASSGIGQAIAIALGKAGANVAVNYHGDDAGADKTKEDIQNHGSKAITIKGDVSEKEKVEQLFSKTTEEFGQIHILVNNAGIQQDEPFKDMKAESWDQVIRTKLYGAFYCAQQAARIFIKQGMDDTLSKAKGKIIFISSVHDTIPWAGRVNYAASKGGLLTLMQSLAQELAPEKIRVNNISPGAIKTPINEEDWKDENRKKALLAKIPYGRIGEPEDVAKAVVWLASDDADYITGTTLYVDGGMTLYPSFLE
jgi:glucose 1-dehydrogenase